MQRRRANILPPLHQFAVYSENMLSLISSSETDSEITWEIGKRSNRTECYTLEADGTGRKREGQQDKKQTIRKEKEVLLHDNSDEENFTYLATSNDSGETCDESKLQLKDAIIHLEQVLLKNDLVSQESSKTISHEAMQIGEELYKSTIEILGNKTFVETEELFLMREPNGEYQFREKVQNDDSDEYTPPEKEPKLVEYIPLEYKIKVVNMVKEHPKWSLKNLQRKGCSRLKSKKYLYRWEEDIKRGGTIIDKYTLIDSWTYDRFVEARNSYQQVTTRQLQQWALSAASQFCDFPFKASDSWVKKFKKQHKIKQCKITKYVSAKETATINEILAAADIFRKQMMILIPNFHKDFIINTDQIECQYHTPTYNKNLFMQTQTVYVQQQSVNNLYTAQYAITMSGKLLPHVFICLQEVAGVFSPEIKKTIEEYAKIYTNIVVTSSKSGKFSTYLYTQFLKKVLAPYVGQKKFLLIIDSWDGQTNPALYDEMFLDNDNIGTCTIKVIPPKCMLCQPCDVYFYRQVRNFIKRLQTCPFLIERGRKIASREDCIKIHSIVHHQLSSPIFENMLRYAWFASKLTNERDVYMNVNQVCFPIDILKQLCDCKKTAFIRCARCRINYCFVCFYDKYHPTMCIISFTSTNE